MPRVGKDNRNPWGRGGKPAGETVSGALPVTPGVMAVIQSLVRRCKRGHVLGEDTGYRDGHGCIVCAECARERQRQYRKRLRGG